MGCPALAGRASVPGPPARPDRDRRPRGRRRRPAQRRAREARHLHRYRDRPGPHERSAHRRDRERRPRVGARRAGPDERAATVRAGLVLRPGRALPETHARSRATDVDPSVAHRARRRVRERRAVEAPLVLPACRRGDGDDGAARVRGRAHTRRRHGRVDARQDRGRRARRRRVPRPHVHEPHVDAGDRADPASTAWCSTTACACA